MRTKELIMHLKYFSKNKIPKHNYHNAFTLAEVLFTLAVIGIVSSMTIPSLLNKMQGSDSVVRVKKVYSILYDAFQRTRIDGVDVGAQFAGDYSSGNVYNVFAPYLNVQKECGTNAGCFPHVMYKFLDGTNWGIFDGDSRFYTVALTDGTLLLFYDLSTVDEGSNWGGVGNFTDVYATMYMDINGEKGPNKAGRDLFEFVITPQGIYPRGGYGDQRPGYSCDPTNVVLLERRGFGCAGRILRENAINY